MGVRREVGVRVKSFQKGFYWVKGQSFHEKQKLVLKELQFTQEFVFLGALKRSKFQIEFFLIPTMAEATLKALSALINFWSF